MQDLITGTEHNKMMQASKNPASLMSTEEGNATDAKSIELSKVEGDRPSNIPEKFWDKKNNAIRIGALVQSYIELERKLSSTLPMPGSDEDKVKLFKALGQPESPDMYDIDLSHGLFDLDPHVNQKLFDNGLSRDQVQAVYDLAAEKFVPLILDMAEEFKADREVERLIATFGGTEKWQEVSRQLLAYGEKNLPADVLDNLSKSFEGVMMLYRMMKGQEPALASQNDMKSISNSGETDLHGMMRDPKYWRDKDPKFVAKVTEGFKQLYSN